MNGNVATKGTIVSSGNMNINGTRTENADESMIFIFDKIDNQYFSASNVDEYDEDYTLDELNININVPTEVQGEATLTGNININNALKALEDVNLYGEVKNTNDSVIFSKYGDIVIDSQNVNLNGLVYAPFGSVTINAQNLNLNNVVIIAESIILTCPNVNANNSSNASSFVGTTSDPLDIPYDEWQYMKDENENAFPDFFENSDNWRLLKDTDGDQLPDCVEQFIGTDATLVDSDSDMLDDYYEVFVTGTDPVLPDTDNNGIADGDEDFDTDGLTNYQEYIQGTSPWDSDSDSDDLSDGDEVNIYSTNPLEPDTDNDGLSDSDEIALGTNPNLPDTDGDGTLDGQERFAQTYVYNVSEEGCAVEQVIVSMEGTGNLQNTMSVDNIMDKDVICSGVVGLVGVPFSIETTSDFETATLSFKIDQSKLGDTDFNDLLFLWYDEDNHNFVELDTIYDETNSTVSIETTHFSRYMVVDKYSWFGAWSKELNYTSITYEKSAVYSVLAVDCSGSMSTYDPITIISPNSAPYKPVYSCERQKAVSGFTSALDFDDKAAIVTFESSASTVCELTDDTYDAVESAGIRLQNGNIIYTDPTTKHTDSDGLEDGEEIDPTPKKSEKIEYNDDGTVKTVKGYYFVMKSDPREEDTDGDGALDFEDATPSNYNEKMSYIFTKTDCQWFITHESILREVDMNNDGKSVTHKYTVSANDFKNEWNSMGLNGDGKKEFIIDEVHLIYHGAPQLICVSDSGWIYSDSSASGYSSSDITVADLDAKEIEYLNISSCNGGNLDFNSTNGIAGYGDNMALTFLKSNSRIDKVTGWDGSASYGGLYFNFFGNEAVVSWESSSTSDNFDNWSLAVNGYKRKAEQRITYTKNADGTINIDPNEKHRRFFQ